MRKSELITIIFICFSHELQTCDWPRNVICVSGKREIFDADDFSGQVWPDIPRITPEAPKKNVVNIIPVSYQHQKMRYVLYAVCIV